MSKVLIQTAKSQRSQVDNMQRTHKRELEAIEQNFQSRKADLRKNHEDSIIDIKNENHKQVVSENEKKEKVLEQMRKNIQEHKVLTDKQLEDLKTTATKTTEDLRTKNSLDRDRISQENEAHLAEMNDKFNEKARDIRYQGQRNLDQMDSMEKEKFMQVKDYHQKRVSDQTIEFNKRYTHDEQKYREFKDVQDKTFEKERFQTHTRQQKEISKLTKEQQFQLEQRNKHYLQALKQQDEFEKQKWVDTMKVHTENFKNLEELNKKVVTKVKTDMAKEVSQVVKRSDDQFYQFTQLNPKLTSFPDRVEIEVPVPDHSKQDLQLTTNNKEVVVVFNRRFQDTNKNQLGSSKVHRVESYTSRINVDAILDPRSVKSSYDNGVMTYVIKKV